MFAVSLDMRVHITGGTSQANQVEVPKKKKIANLALNHNSLNKSPSQHYYFFLKRTRWSLTKKRLGVFPMRFC